MSFPELVKALGEGIYGPDLTGGSLEDIDRAVMNHLSRTVADLPALVSGKTREVLTMLLMRADLENIKTVLRGQALGWSVDEIKGRLSGGTLPQGLYSTMAQAPDAAALAQVVSLPNPLLAEALREASRTGKDLMEMEFSFDRSFYMSALQRARELKQPFLVAFISLVIDAANLATGLKLFTVGFGEEPDHFFLEGGKHVKLDLFRRLAKGDLAALQDVKDTEFGRVSEATDLVTLERMLRCVLLDKAREGTKDVLGAGLAIDYIQHKEWEGARIRLLARRAYYNLASALVEKEVFCQ